MVNDRQCLYLMTFAGPVAGPAVEWRISDSAVPYPEAVAEMESRAADIAAGKAGEMVWLLEHPPLYTSGTSGRNEDLLDPRFPLFTTGRGGQLTYHGPGQRVAYVMLDLRRRRPDVRAYVAGLEEWIRVASARRCGAMSCSGFVAWVADPSAFPGHPAAAILPHRSARLPVAQSRSSHPQRLLSSVPTLP